MAEHTPGPWAAPYFDKNPGDEGWWVHNGQRGQDEYAVAVTFRLNPRAEADARLIAAAPELLEALRWFVDDEPCRLDHGGFCQTHGVTKPCLNQAAGMVILKAEGRQP